MTAHQHNYSNPRISFTNWLTGSQEEPGNRCHSCSASAQTMEAEPPDMRYQALPGNEYNRLGLLYIITLVNKFRFCDRIYRAIAQN